MELSGVSVQMFNVEAGRVSPSAFLAASRGPRLRLDVQGCAKMKPTKASQVESGQRKASNLANLSA